MATVKSCKLEAGKCITVTCRLVYTILFFTSSLTGISSTPTACRTDPFKWRLKYSEALVLCMDPLLPFLFTADNLITGRGEGVNTVAPPTYTVVSLLSFEVNDTRLLEPPECLSLWARASPM